ncbi:MAG: hypothetical protein IKY91_03505 [Akkermansia sp.]|nr:hypothetical protein [Akkermansia sp.]
MAKIVFFTGYDICNGDMPAVAALPLWRGSLPFYFALLHKKFRLGKPKGSPSRSFFSEKNGGWSIADSNR